MVEVKREFKKLNAGMQLPWVRPVTSLPVRIKLNEQEHH